jgi:hypothetical protein
MERFTTTDLLEIETLLIYFGKAFIFTPMLLVKDRNELLINDLLFKTFLDFMFPDSYTVNDKTIAVDYNIFKILQLRYFRYNETVNILE